LGKALITLILAALVALAAACSDDDDDSGDGATATPSVCDQKEALDQSVEDLTNLDAIASGTDGLTAALEVVQTDLEDLAQTVSADIQPEVEGLETAVSDAEETLSSIGDDASLSEQIDAVQEALTGIGTAAAALGESLQNECS